MNFGLWDALSGGSQVGITLSQSVTVTGGVFSAPLDFGDAAFTGGDRWLEIGVDCPGGGGFMTLQPRQPVTAAPYALAVSDQAGDVAGGVRLGSGALGSNSTGGSNTAVGDTALASNTTGSANTAMGQRALNANTTAGNNTAMGSDALGNNVGSEACTAFGQPFQCCDGLGSGNCGTKNTATGASALESNTVGYFNTAVGSEALKANTDGRDNLAVGILALYSNTHGNHNTAVGNFAATSVTTGEYNTAVGDGALFANKTGSNNTAIGNYALAGSYGTSASENTAIGALVLISNETGADNSAVGYQALSSNTTGNYNTAMGQHALNANTTAHYNTAFGHDALGASVAGANNTALGADPLDALTNGANNTAVGADAFGNLIIGSNNIAIGNRAGYAQTSGANNILIGNEGSASGIGFIRIGTVGTHNSVLIAGINAAGVPGGSPVYVNALGQLGTVNISSRRYKDDIRDMRGASSGLLRLRPVTFRYKPELNASGVRQYGLIAEEVAAVFPDLVVYDQQGQVEGVRYDLLSTLLLNELQKQQRAIEQQRLDNASLQERLDRIERSVQAIAAQPERVAARVSAEESLAPVR